jgi:hypothetical protein
VALSATRPFAPLAVLALAVGLLAGCGGSGGGSKKSADEWASGYCNAATTWVTNLEQTRASARSGATTPSEAAQTVSLGTQTFTQTIDKLGQPDTADGATSEATAKDLTLKLQGHVGRASAAATSTSQSVTVAARKKVVDTQIGESFADVASTTKKLAKDDAALGTAIDASSDCKALDKALAGAG